jgi:hypothetical protein
MSLKNRRAKSISVDAYYKASWCVVIALTAFLVTASQSARPQMTLPFYVLSYLFVSKWSGSLRQWSQALRRFTYVVLVALVVDLTVTYEGVDTVLRSLIEVVSALFFLSLTRYERQRSYWFGILSVAVVAIGCMTFAASIVVYIVFTLLILAMIFNMNAANLGLRDENGNRPTEKIHKTYFRQFILATPPGLLGAAIIFLMFPRVQNFYLPFMNFGLRNHTGYSGEVSLSPDGEIEESQDLALIVTGRDEAWLRKNASNLLFRGNSLDLFQDSKWSNSVRDFEKVENFQNKQVSNQFVRALQNLVVHAEWSQTAAIFYPGVLFGISRVPNGKKDFLINSAGSIIRGSYDSERISYALTIAPTVEGVDESVSRQKTLSHLKREVGSVSYEKPLFTQLSSHMRAAYLEVPREIANEDFFLNWRNEIGIELGRDTLTTAMEKIKANFLTKFKASLKNDLKSEETLKDFLTVSRHGHCEYFATVSALLMRSFGIPARVVVGYKGGTYNAIIGALEVREENGHAWVEVFIPKVGWQAFDPTPSNGNVTVSNSFQSKLRLWSNAASFFFRQYVIDYDYKTQKNLLSSLRSLGQKGDSGKKAEENKNGRENFAVIVFGITIVGVFTVIILWIRRRAAADSYPKYYSVFRQLLIKKGLQREDTESLRLFHERLKKSDKITIDAALLTDVNHAIHLDLYGRVGISLNEQEHLCERVKAM